MPFGRSWAGRWLGASGAAIAVPTGLVLTIVVVAVIAGGDGGLGGLGQLTRGPEIPGVAVGAPVRSTPLDSGLPVLPRRTAVKAPRGAAASSAPSPGGRRPSRRPAHRAPAARPSRPSRPVTAPASPVASAPSPPATPAPAPATAPAPAPAKPATRPNPLREGVRTVQGVVSTLPLVGPPVADAVGSVADLILPPLPGQTAPAP